MVVYFFALLANFAFASASIGYEHYTRRFGVLFVNWYKAAVSIFGLLVLMTLGKSVFLLSSDILVVLFLSGLIGLGIGDLFLLRAFVRIGTSRSLMLFGFHPLLVGFVEHYYFGAQFKNSHWISVSLLIASLFVISFEKYKRDGNWEFKGLILAFLCVLCDAIGVVMTKWAFMQTDLVTSISANFYRTFGAFFILSLGIKFVKWPIMTFRQHTILGLASIVGTLISLLLYLEAIKHGSLAIVSSIAITAPLIAGIIECIIQKKWPSRYLIFSFILFSAGLVILAHSIG